MNFTSIFVTFERIHYVQEVHIYPTLCIDGLTPGCFSSLLVVDCPICSSFILLFLPFFLIANWIILASA